MTEFVPRTVSVIGEDQTDSPKTASKRLAEYRDCSAYVLLGSPGAGKTTAFQLEADAHENGMRIPARDFIALDDPEWPDKLLFIDGLDEMRAGAQDGRTPIDQIRGKLQRLGCSRFRLSCRTVDWWWTNDRQKLEQIGVDVLLLALDPLTDESLPEILRQHGRPKNGSPKEFVSQARARGLGEWLRNPQTLLRLADSIDEQGDWPHSRRDLYEKACETLLSETNEEHILSGTGQISLNTLSKTAGRMCAVQLLSGSAGYTLPPGKPNKDYPALEKVVSIEIGKQTARTRAFDKIPELERVVPEHQCTAEFLGGRYLAEQVERGFPANRILTLMSSADKVVVPRLQGVAAWFAVYSRPARKKLIEDTPLEIILHGDVESFDTEDKILLLDKLREKTSDNPWCISIVRRSTHLRGLASPNLHEYLEEALRRPATSHSEQSFRYLVLKALHCSSDLPEVSDSLLEIIRDEKSWPASKEVALDVLIQSRAGTAAAGDLLKKLLLEIQEGTVQDFRGRLLDTVLAELFPQHISADETLDCLMDSGQPSTATFHISWAGRFVEQLSPQQLTDILNRLVARVNDARQPNLSRASFRPFRVFLAILQNLFSPVPDREINLLDLRHWLETAWCSEIQQTVSSSFAQIASSIHDWFRLQPDKHREIFEDGVREWIDADNFNLRACETGNWLFGLRPEPDFWPWCLDLAIQSQAPKTAEFYLRQVAGALFDGNTEINLSLDDIQAQVAKRPELEKAFKAMLVDSLPENHFKEIEDRQRRIAMDLHEREQWHQNWVATVQAHETELRENRGPLGLLYNLALAYEGGFYDVAGDQPLERIRNLLDRDPHLVQLVLESFKNSISHEDAPSVGEIIRCAKQGQPHLLTYPCLAGLKETGVPPSTDQQIRRALAFHYFADYALPGEVGLKDLAWYESLLAQRPELVAEILIRRIRSQMRNGEEFLTDSHELAFSGTHAKVASLAALPLLKSFPVRCATRQLHDLGYLLAAALLHCKRTELRKLLEEKLSANKTKSMDIGQHVYWLAARFLIAPKTHLRPLGSYLHGDDRRVRYFAEFTCQGSTSPEWDNLLKGKCLVPLIQLLGSSFRYISLDEGVAWSSPPMAASGMVRELINHLADNPSRTATETLNRLVADDSLSKWRIYLQDAADKHYSLRRQSEFTHCSVSEVLRALDQNKPANMDDLVVLLLEDFNEMGKKIRDGSTNDWHQYWNQSPKQSPEEWSPKYEADCRDAFLSDLQEKLKPLDIRAAREGSYADDTRADIQVSYKNLSLPIEIKKSHSKDLWKGTRDQLVKYKRDPDADGRGIYLVFWFGEDSPRNPETKMRPASPDELRHQLEDSLTPEEADKVSIHVIDVARP
ncbi:MAG: hypothetical protein OXC38_07010 [Gammaproteobacteria bacterium]|nr:hypothetical protein [Gammaproteobacteria bacterium]